MNIEEEGVYKIPLNTAVPVAIEMTSSYEPVDVSLYEHEGVNRYEIEVPEDELGNGYEVTVERAGTYTIVIGVVDSVAHTKPAQFFVSLKEFFFSIAHAQEAEVTYVRTFTVALTDTPDCGSITNLGGEVIPITNCDNPFNEDSSFSHVVTNIIGETRIGEAVEVVVPANQSTVPWTFEFAGGPFLYFSNAYLYKKDGDNYLEIARLQGPTASQDITISESGTYSVVSVIDEKPVLSQNETWWDTLKSFFLPQAVAYFADQSHVQQLTFTVTVEELTGASSVLFLPGIQASRLYSQDEGDEEQLWEPWSNDEVRRLSMTESGESIENIYTRDVIEEIGGITIGSNIYKGFLSYLRGIDGFDGPLVETFPYDWRKDVFDIVKNGTRLENGNFERPTTTIAFLASLSPTGKTTIIAHSNGGLLAKAIMLELEREGKSDLVDKIIFIATPQLGTPKTLATILHGYDQKDSFGGIFIDDVVARDVIKNMPGAYALLPSEQYLSELSSPLITFDNSSITKIFRDAYGFAVTNIGEYTDFLTGEEGRVDAEDNINEPSVANDVLLNEALAIHKNKLDNWTAPSGVEIYNIIGTGLVTPKSFEYREYAKNNCGVSPGVCIPTKVEPAISFTRYGDGTVVSKSASSYLGEIESVYLNLFKIKRYEHSNITESDTVQLLVDRILHSSSTDDMAFTSTEEPIFNYELDITVIHSPARVHIVDTDGNITGRTESEGKWREEILDSSYFEIGGAKYVVVPSGIDYEVVIEGEGDGVYSLSTDILNRNDEQANLHEFTATVTPEMRASYTKEEGMFGVVTVDEDGDGVSDFEITLDGDVTSVVSTYADLRKAINKLSIKKKNHKKLLLFATLAERFYQNRDKQPFYEKIEERILKRIMKRINRLYKKNKISSEEYQEIQSIITRLIKQ